MEKANIENVNDNIKREFKLVKTKKTDILGRLKNLLGIGRNKEKINDLIDKNTKIQDDSLSIQNKGLEIIDEITNITNQLLKTQNEVNKNEENLRIDISNKYEELTSSFKELYIEIGKEKIQLSKSILENEKHKKELEKRDTEIRKTEIYHAAKDSELRKRQYEIEKLEKAITKKENDFYDEKKRIEKLDKGFTEREKHLSEREIIIKKKESEIEQREKKLIDKERAIEDKRFEIEARYTTLEKKEKESATTYSERERKWSEIDKEKEELKAELETKIHEYDKKLVEIESIKDTVDLFKYDSSTEGKQGKLVVQEALRQTEKLLKDSLEHIQSIQEKYSGGTFKGFAIQLSKIEESKEELLLNIQTIKEYAESNSNIPLQGFIDEIEKCYKEAIKSLDLWEFETSYTNSIRGIAICSALELFLNTLNKVLEEETEKEEQPSAKTTLENYYEILGIDRNASQEDIKKAYRELAKKYHPDKNKDNIAKMMFTKINQANETLSDEEKRKQYNETFFNE